MKKLAKLLSAVLAALMLFSCIPMASTGAFALDSVIPTAETVVLNAADNTATVSYRDYQSLAAMSVGNTFGYTPTDSYITAKYYGTTHWNDWATFAFQLTIPEGESIDGAQAIAMWVDFSQTSGTEYWQMAELNNAAGTNLFGVGDENDEIYFVDNCGNISKATTFYNNIHQGVNIAGYKGWIIAPIANNANLSDVVEFAFSRNATPSKSPNAQTCGKPVYLDSVTAVMNLDEFIAAEAAKLSASYADMLNDFDTTQGVTSKLMNAKVTTNGLDGSGLKIEGYGQWDAYTIIPFEQTDLSQYEAIAFYVEGFKKLDGADAFYTFKNFRYAADSTGDKPTGTAITNAQLGNSEIYFVSSDGSVTELVSAETGYWRLPTDCSGYVVAPIREDIDPALLNTNGLMIKPSQWHGTNKYNGKEMYIDNLIAVKDMEAFALTVSNSSTDKLVGKLGTPTVEYTGINNSTAIITWEAVASEIMADGLARPVNGSDNYDVVIYNGKSKTTVNTAETSYTLNINAGENLMVQVVAKRANTVLGAYNSVSLTGHVIGVFNDFSDPATYSAKTNATVSEVKDTMGGNAAKVSGYKTSTKIRVENTAAAGSLKAVEGILIAVDNAEMVGINYLRIFGYKDGVQYDIVGDSSPTVYTNVIDPATGTVLSRNNWWNAHGIQAAAGKNYYYLVELVDARVPTSFDCTDFEYFEIERSPWQAIDAADSGKSFTVDTLAYVTDKAAFLANPAEYIYDIGVNPNYNAEDAAPAIAVSDEGTATITVPAVDGADKVVVNVYDEKAILIASEIAENGVVTVEGLKEVNFGVQVLGYAADALVYTGKPACYKVPSYKVLNDFDDINTVVSTLPNTTIVEANDGSALAYDTAKSKQMTITIPETNFKDYEAIAFYVETGDTPFAFNDIQTAAGKRLTDGYHSKGTASTVTNFYYVDAETKAVTNIMGPHWENGYYNLPANAKGYVIAIINDSGYRLHTKTNGGIVVDSATPVTDADFITDKLVIQAATWHDASAAANQGKTHIMDDLMVVKNVEEFIADLGVTGTHKHIYTQLLTDITLQKDCLSTGAHTSICYCGNKLNYTVAATNHQYSTVVDAAVAPTCTETGLTEGKHCSACGEVLVAQEVVAALGHTAGADATCTTDQVCTVCGEVLVAALGHTEVIDAAVAPTCTTTGLTEGKHCSVCGEVLVAQETVDALGHTEVIDEAVAPTLNSTGLTEGKHCSVCGEILVAQEVIEKLSGEATVNGTNYATLEEAIAAANAGDTVYVNADVQTEAILTIDKAITLDGQDHSITYAGTASPTTVRVINVDTTGDVVIKNLEIEANAERAINIINKPANVTIENVKADVNNYAVMVATSAAGANVTINDSTLTGLNVVNVASANSEVEINNTTLINKDNTDKESYSAIAVYTTAENTSIVVNGGQVIVADDSVAATIIPTTATVVFNDTLGATEVAEVVAMIGDAGFYTLAEALNYKDGVTVKVIRDVELDATVVIEKDVVLDLNGHTVSAKDGATFIPMFRILSDVTVKNGTVDGREAEAYAFIVGSADVADAVLTIVDGNIYGATSAVSVTKGTLNIEGGYFEATPYNGDHRYTINCIDANYKAGLITLNITGGAYYMFNPYDNLAEGAGTNFLPAGKHGVEENNVYTIENHTIVNVEAKAPTCTEVGWNAYEKCDVCGYTTYEEIATIAHNHESAVTTVPTTTTKGEKTYTCANCGDTYTEEMDVLPKPIVENLGATTTTIDSYYIYNLQTGKLTTATGGFNMQMAMDFSAPEAEADGTYGSYEDYYTDFFIEMNGLSADKVSADGCYLAGYYESYGAWVVIPLDGFEIENGFAYPVISLANFHFTYEMICEDVKNFTCGIYLSEEFLAANPNVEVDLNLGLTEEPVEDLTVEAPFFTVEDYVYDKEDLSASVVAEVNGIKFYDLQQAVDYAKEGATVELVADVELDATVIISTDIVLDLGGYTVSAKDGATFIPMFRVLGDVTVKNGTVDGREADAYAFIVGNADVEDAVLTIVDGNIYGATSAVSVTKGTLNIEGGYFEATEYKGDHRYTINCIDGNYKAGLITLNITGGSYYKFNPYDNLAEGEGTNFLPAGKHGVATGDIYTIGDHTIVNVEAKAPTCTEIGWNAYEKCDVCGYTTYEELAALGHTEVIDAAVAPDCTNTGLTEGSHCSVCGEVFVEQTEIAALGHNYESAVTVVPTTTTKGEKTYTCTVCGDTYTEEMDVLPQPIVENLGATTTTIDSYYIYNLQTGSLTTATGGFNMQMTMDFSAPEAEADGTYGSYEDYYTDFFIEMNGLSADKVSADGCYLAGYYESYGAWVVIPLDGFEIENGFAYPVISLANFHFTYEMICKDVKDFTCGIYLSEEFLAANPNVEVDLNLGLTEEPVTDFTVEAPFFTVEDYVYDSEDLATPVVAEVNGIKFYDLQQAVDYAKDGATVELVADVELDATVIISTDIVLDLGGYTVSAKDGATFVPMFRVLGDVTVKNGTVDGRDASAYAFIVGSTDVDDAVLTIVDGTYYGSTTAVSVTKGTLNIEGGYFEATEYKGDHRYTINCIDANYKAGLITLNITGGSYYKFNPYDNLAEGEGTNFLPAGKHGVATGDIYTIEDHTIVNVEAKAPTCTEIGWNAYEKCDVCGYTTYEELAALGHTEVIDAAVAPDCTNTGLTEGSHCEVCGEVIVAQEIVDALGHTEVIDAAVAPDCTNTGLTEGKHCSVCGEVLVAQEVVDALGHSYVEEVIPATPDAQGYTKHTCSVCGDTYNDNFVDYVPVVTPAEDLDYTLDVDGIVIEKYNGTEEIVILPDTIDGLPVIGIGEKAFYVNKTVTSVTFPATLKFIRANAFRGCSALTEVVWNEGLETIGTYAFGGTKLTEIVFPSTLQTIGVSAFNGVTTLTSIDLANVTTIKGSAFANCTALCSTVVGEVLVIPETVYDIGAHAFLNCTSIKRVDWHPERSKDGSIGNLENPAFKGAWGIDEVRIYDTAVYLPSYMFLASSDPANREGITTLRFMGTPKVKEIGDRAFYQTRIGTLNLPNSLEKIGRETFRNVNMLRVINFGTGIHTIGQNAFSNCNNLPSVTIPGNVKTIYAYAFRDCALLKTVVIEEGVDYISSYIFMGTSLESITLPASITKINSGLTYGTNATINYIEGTYVDQYLHSAAAKIQNETLVPIA